LSFVHNSQKNVNPQLIGTIEGCEPFVVNIKANGSLEFINLPEKSIGTKVRFAYVTAGFAFSSPQDEVYGFKHIFTSSQQNLRYLYHKLPENSKNHIYSQLHILFGITEISGKNNQIFITERNNHTKLEISFQGSAVQKVFATLILFHTLVRLESKAEQRIFLVEEPESLLYPSLLSEWFRNLYFEARKNNIQMIVTSNSSHVIDCFQNKIVLSSESPSIIAWDYDIEVMRITASISSNKPIIFVDGDNDITFLRTLFPEWSDQYQIISRRGRKDVCKFFIDEYAKPQKLKVLSLRDKEFVLPDLINDQAKLDAEEFGTPVVYWKLPCIESYLILHLFLTQDQEEMKAKFKKYHQCLRHSTQYFLGVTQGVSSLLKKTNQTDYNSRDIGHYWLEAIKQIDEPTPVWRKVVEVIHGHTWLNEFVYSNEPISTENLLPLICPNLHNDVRKLLNEAIEALDHEIKFYKIK